MSCARRPSFTHTELLKYRRSYDAFDEDDTGVAPGQLGKLANKLGYRLTEEQLSSLLSNNNTDPESRLSFEDFLDMVPRNLANISAEEHRLAELRAKFQQYDRSHSGVVSLEEAQLALQAELNLTPQTSLKMLNQFVKLDYEQFVQFYKKVEEKKLEIYAKFGKYDSNKDGLISVEEAHSVLREELGLDEDKSKAMVDHFDLNQDGKVSYGEFAEFYIAVEDRKTRIRQAFQRFDKDNQGYVSLEQAQEILEGLLGFSPQRCKQIITVYDKNHDDKIDYEEFLAFYTMLEEERQKLMREFKSYDADGDGRISFQEFHQMLESKNYKEDEIKILMAGSDKNHDGFLDFEEFKHFLNFT